MRRFALVLVGLLLACPLFAWPGAGYDAVRLPAVLLLVSALMMAAFVASARAGERPPGPAPLRTAGVLLLAVNLLSVLAVRLIADAVVPILILFSGVAVFSCLRGGIVPREGAIRLLAVIPIVGMAVAGIGFIQGMAGFFRIDEIVRLVGGEPASTEGNRNYAGGLCAMLLPVTIALTRTGPHWSRTCSIVSSAMLAVLLLLTESRGGLCAAVAGLAIAGAAMGWRRVERGPAAAGVAVLLILAGFGAFQLRRQVSPERMETAGFRLDVWKSGLRMAAARPLLGWGVGGFQAEYPPFRSESEFRFSHTNITDAFKELEDPHSSWVQVAVEMGVPGLLAFLLVVYVAARLWRYYVKVAPDPDRAAMLAGLGGGAAAYLVAGLFNSLTLKTSHTVMFWAFLGLIELVGETRPWRPASRSREWRAGISAAAAVVAFFAALWSGRLGAADRAFTSGMATN